MYTFLLNYYDYAIESVYVIELGNESVLQFSYSLSPDNYSIYDNWLINVDTLCFL